MMGLKGRQWIRGMWICGVSILGLMDDGSKGDGGERGGITIFRFNHWFNG